VLIPPCSTRKGFLQSAGLIVAAAATDLVVSRPARAAETVGVSPTEDLMREHGALARILLIYEHQSHRLPGETGLRLDLLAETAGMVHRFIEGYHEKLEEDHLFPRFEQAGQLVDLVTVLRAQHAAGRAVTEEIMCLTATIVPPSRPARIQLDRQLRLFIRMYRPHKAREDTILFPALHSMMSQKTFDALGDQFEDQEHKVLGPAGFEGVVERLGQIERELGLYDLAQFSPRK
jgi:hemerythrin-like domain-containing protein